MSERLTSIDLARMRAEHVADNYDNCAFCWTWRRGHEVDRVHWPCDAAKLLAHFAPGPVPHLAGIAAGLFGPSRTEELAH